MRYFGLYDGIQSYLDMDHIRRLFAIQDQGYLEPTLEFLYTLRVDIEDLPNEMLEWITFRVAGMLVTSL